MSVRYKTYTKVGKGKYITTNNSLKDIILVNIFLWIFIYPTYYLFKGCFVLLKKIYKYIYNKAIIKKQKG